MTDKKTEQTEKETTNEKVTVVNPQSSPSIQAVQADAEYWTLRRMREEEEEKKRKADEADRKAARR